MTRLHPATFRAMEGELELEFQQDEDFVGTRSDWIQHLRNKGFTEEEIELFFFLYEDTLLS